jgi:hypothetical protein
LGGAGLDRRTNLYNLLNMKLSILTPHNLSLFGGMSLGLLFGDYVSPQLEAALGDPLGDIVFAAGGAAIGSLVYEVVAGVRGKR